MYLGYSTCDWETDKSALLNHSDSCIASLTACHRQSPSNTFETPGLAKPQVGNIQRCDMTMAGDLFAEELELINASMLHIEH